MLKVNQLEEAGARVPARQALDTQLCAPLNLRITLSLTLPPRFSVALGSASQHLLCSPAPLQV